MELVVEDDLLSGWLFFAVIDLVKRVISYKDVERSERLLTPCAERPCPQLTPCPSRLVASLLMVLAYVLGAVLAADLLLSFPIVVDNTFSTGFVRAYRGVNNDVAIE